MALDFIFGPRTRLADHGRPDGPVWTRSVAVDLDSLRDVIQLARDWSAQEPILMIHASGPNSSDREVSVDDLPTMTEEERRRLSIQSHSRPDLDGEPRSVIIAFAGPSVAVEPNGAHWRDRIVDRLLGEKRPLVDWKRLKSLEAVALTILLALLWLIVERTASMPPAAHVLGWIVALAIIRFGWKQTKQRLNGLHRTAGHRIALESRLDIIRRRNGYKRDVQVAALSVLGTVVAGVVTAAVAYSVGWSPA